MAADVKKWSEECLTCARFRRRPEKLETVAVKPVTAHPWEEVIVDCEGPSTPSYYQRNTHTLTYLCAVCGGVFLEPLKGVSASEVRRAFARCMFRAGSLPSLVRSDRGSEFKNALMAEFLALVNARHRFGTAWRPCEQGAVERAHQETSRILGMLVTDVMRAEPSEWSELLVVVEFAVYNTPLTDTGITPRDLDRRWSLATPLEKGLRAFEVLEWEPVSDYVQRLFTTYRELYSRVSTALFAAREKRAGLVNRFRRSRKIEVGMKVAYRDPRITHTSGRTPWRKPLSGPFEVVGVQGTKFTLTDGGKDRHEMHAEDVVILPAVVEPLEGKEALRVDQDQEEGRRSPGEMAGADPAPAFGTGSCHEWP